MFLPVLTTQATAEIVGEQRALGVPTVRCHHHCSRRLRRQVEVPYARRAVVLGCALTATPSASRTLRHTIVASEIDASNAAARLRNDLALLSIIQTI